MEKKHVKIYQHDTFRETLGVESWYVNDSGMYTKDSTQIQSAGEKTKTKFSQRIFYGPICQNYLD